MHTRTHLGRGGEAAVSTYLINQGFKILALNYTKKFGEIDLIAHKESLLVFVEVKMRSQSIDHWSELVVPSKQKKIIAVAKEYIARHAIDEMTCRFDVAFVEGEGVDARVTYIEDAFQEE